eukprot:g8486.t1
MDDDDLSGERPASEVPCGSQRHRPVVFLDISIGPDYVGRLEIELFDDITPLTAENFRCLCTGEKGLGKHYFRGLHLLNTAIHRVCPRLFLQGGDIVERNGTCGESIYGEFFDDENYEVKHEKGVISMAKVLHFPQEGGGGGGGAAAPAAMKSCGVGVDAGAGAGGASSSSGARSDKDVDARHTNSSQFFICFEDLPDLNGKNVAFGKILPGSETCLELVRNVGSETGSTTKPVFISMCGQLR